MIPLLPSSVHLSNLTPNSTSKSSFSLYRPCPRRHPCQVPAESFAQKLQLPPQNAVSDGISHLGIRWETTGGGEGYRLGLFTGPLYASYVSLGFSNCVA